MLLDQKTLDGLDKGDIAEIGQLFSGMCDDPVVLLLDKRDGETFAFVATYMGITLGKWTACKDGEGVKWLL